MLLSRQGCPAFQGGRAVAGATALWGWVGAGVGCLLVRGSQRGWEACSLGGGGALAAVAEDGVGEDKDGEDDDAEGEGGAGV